MDYNIISTGSIGNAVIINNNILIDCGVPFKALRDAYMNLQLVLLTHIHSDHFNYSTIKKLAQERPTLRFGCHSWLVPPLIECGVDKRNIDVFTVDTGFSYSPTLSIETFLLKHNAPNCGYKIHIDGERLLYATDTNSMDGIEAPNFNLYMLEANYSEAEIAGRIKAKQANGEYCHEWDVLKNHLSKEKADNWLYQNMGPDSKYVYLHQHKERSFINNGGNNE